MEQLAKETADRMAREAAVKVGDAAKALAAAADEKETRLRSKQLQKAPAELAHAKKSADMRAVRRMLQAARSEPTICVPNGGKMFDTRRDLLNCPNGTVELRTGTLREHRREDHITRLCPTRFNPNANRETYLALLDRVFDGQPAVANYVREVSGYALTGEVSDQTLHILTGVGSNGKSALIGTWTSVLGEGEYVHTAPADLLLSDGRGDRHPTEKTGLMGARRVVCSETDEDRYMDEAKMKALTGGDTVTARFMRGDFFQFNATHKLVLLTNYKPRVKGTDHGVWRRMRLVPFEVKFWKDSDREIEPDGDYPERFKANPELTNRLATVGAEGVLADMVEHAAVFYRTGGTLNPPAEVTGATAEYRADQDVIGQFFVARVREDHQSDGIKASVLYKAFLEWWEEEGHSAKRAPSATKFGKLAKRKFSHSAPHCVVYHVRLRSVQESDGPEGSRQKTDRHSRGMSAQGGSTGKGSKPSEPSGTRAEEHTGSTWDEVVEAYVEGEL